GPISRRRPVAPRRGLGPPAVDVAAGSPAAAIRGHAGSVGADLVVTAPAETSRLARRIFYGVTDALLSGGKHDMLIGPAPDARRRAAGTPEAPTCRERWYDRVLPCRESWSPSMDRSRPSGR